LATYLLSAIQIAARTRVSSAHGAPIGDSENSMKKPSKKAPKREVVPDIDFSGGVRGKYAARFAEGTNLVALSPDVAEVFPDSAAVNEALRTLVRISGKSVRAGKARRSAG
jgi:hypothetical protein